MRGTMAMRSCRDRPLPVTTISWDTQLDDDGVLTCVGVNALPACPTPIVCMLRIPPITPPAPPNCMHRLYLPGFSWFGVILHVWDHGPLRLVCSSASAYPCVVDVFVHASVSGISSSTSNDDRPVPLTCTDVTVYPAAICVGSKTVAAEPTPINAPAVLKRLVEAPKRMQRR